MACAESAGDFAHAAFIDRHRSGEGCEGLDRPGTLIDFLQSCTQIVSWAVAAPLQAGDYQLRLSRNTVPPELTSALRKPFRANATTRQTRTLRLK